MGIRAMLWAWNWTLSPTQKMVLIALAWHSDDGGSCWPSQTRLARLSGLSERSVRRAARELEQQNLIRRHRRTTDAGALTSHLYVLQLKRQPPDTVTGPRGQADRPERTPTSRPPGQSGHQKVIEKQRKGTWEKLKDERQRAEVAAEAYWRDQTPAQDRDKWLTLLKGAEDKN